MKRPLSLWPAIFWIATASAALPILAVRYMPFTDMPEQVAAIATVGRILFGGGSAYYEIDATRSQYFLYHASGGLLAQVLHDAVLANQILLALVAALWPLSFRALLRAFGKDERYALFACAVFFDRALVLGFLPFVASIPLALFALALVVRRATRPTWGSWVGLAVAAVALYFTHVSAYFLFCICAAPLVLLAHGARARGRALVVRVAGDLAALAPSALCLLLLSRAGALAPGHALPTETDIGEMSLDRTLRAFPAWTFDLWESHLDEVAAVLFWLGFAAAIVLAEPATEPSTTTRTTTLPRYAALAPLACALALYLFTPFRVGAAFMLNVRLAPVVTLFAVLALPKVRARFAAIPLGLAAAAALVMSGTALHEGRRISSELLGDDFDALLAQIDPHARVAMLNFRNRWPGARFWPYSHAGSYLVARSDSIVAWSFSDLSHWPVHYARAADKPPRHAPFWSEAPCVYRFERDGAYYDDVLVQGPADRFADAPAGPTFTPVATSGVFTLFRKTGPAREGENQPDVGPCGPHGGGPTAHH